MNINNNFKINNQVSKLMNKNPMMINEKNNMDKISFETFLKDSLKEVNDIQLEAERQGNLLATGQVENIHDVTIASTKAKISLDLTMAVRNKVIEAYKEIMRMQV